ALLPRHEQGLGSCERNRAGLGEQTLRQLRRQSGQQTFRSGKLRHRQSRPFDWTHPQSHFGPPPVAKGRYPRALYARIYALSEAHLPPDLAVLALVMTPLRVRSDARSTVLAPLILASRRH